MPTGRITAGAVVLLLTIAAGCTRGRREVPGGVDSTRSPGVIDAPYAGPLLDPGTLTRGERAPDLFRARFETNEGAFVVEVHRDWASRGADRFHTLVRNGFFDGQRFFRVRAGFIAQFGLHRDPRVIAAWKPETIVDDSVRTSNVRGTLAYAMTGPNTRSTQIFINLVDNRRLDAQGFSPFARVVTGMEVVDRLYSGYDENAGGGMRGGKQGPIEQDGNAYLQRAFPELDYIVRVVIL